MSRFASSSPISSALMSSLHNYSTVLITYADVDYTGGTKGQTGFQGLNSPRQQHHLLPGGIRDASRWLQLQLSWLKSCSQFLESLPRHTSSNHNHNKGDQKPGWQAAPPHVHVGPLQWVTNTVAGGTALTTAIQTKDPAPWAGPSPQWFLQIMLRRKRWTTELHPPSMWKFLIRVHKNAHS